MPLLSNAPRIVLTLALCLGVSACWKSSEERAAEHYQRGLELVAKGDSSRAIVEFRNTLKYVQNDPEARRQIGALNLASGNKKVAYTNYLRLVEKVPEDTEGRVVLSELAFQFGSWDEFERHSKEAVRLVAANPEDKAVFDSRAAAIDLARRYRDAVLAKDDPARAAILAEAEALQVESAADNAILRQILIDGFVFKSRYDDALAQLEQSVSADPEDARNYMSRVEIFARKEDYAALEAELRRVITVFPEDDNAKALLLRFLMSRGEVDKAEAFLVQLVEESSEEERDDAYASLIQFVLETRGAEAALDKLETEIAARPEADSLRLLRASLRFDDGARDAGIIELQDLLANEANTLTEKQSENAKTGLARMLSITGNEVGARKLVEEVLAANPNAVAALKMQSAWLIRSDDTDGAIAALRTALDQAPKDAGAMTLMATAYQRAGNNDLMLNFLSLAVEATGNGAQESMRYAAALIEDGKLVQAETALIASLRITPGNVDVLTMLGQIYPELDDMGRARQVLETLREIDTEQSRASADALNLRILEKEQGSEEALAFLERLAGGEGGGADQTKLAVIRARIANGDPKGALAYAQDLVDQNPDNLLFRYALALANASLLNFDLADTQLTELLTQQPQVAQGWMQLARIRGAAGRPEEARAAIEQGLQAVPESPDLLWAKASQLQLDGDIEGAIAIFEGLYERNSESSIVANNLASLLSTYRDDEASLTRAEIIARRLANTDVAAFQDTYGWIRHLRGDSAEALSYLEPAAEGLPQDYSVQFHLGMAYAALDRTDEAVAQLRRALEVAGPVNVNDPLMTQARAKLEELQAATESDQN